MSLVGWSRLSPASSSEGHGCHVDLDMSAEKILEAGTCVTIQLRFGNPRPLLIDRFLLNIPYVCMCYVCVCECVKNIGIIHAILWAVLLKQYIMNKSLHP